MHDQRGFTIAEIMITLVVIGMVMIGISTIFISIQRIRTQAMYMETANRAAQRQVETLRNSNYNSLTPGQTIDFTDQLPSNLPAGSTGSTLVSEPVSGLRRVDVHVRYSYAGTPRDITLSSLIGVIGVTQ